MTKQSVWQWAGVAGESGSSLYLLGGCDEVVDDGTMQGIIRSYCW